VAKNAEKIAATGTGGGKSSYEKWVEGEGIPIIKTFFAEDIRTVKLEPWGDVKRRIEREILGR